MTHSYNPDDYWRDQDAKAQHDANESERARAEAEQGSEDAEMRTSVKVATNIADNWCSEWTVLDRERFVKSVAEEIERGVNPGACKWTVDDDCGAYDTRCGGKFLITEGTPRENGMKFCCYCGKKLEGAK
jgi:hypothetical protein